MTELRLNGETTVAGVIGWPVRHSLSPPMHNAAFAALGLNWVYVPFAVQPERVAGAVEAIRALDLVGLNVTIPHKLAVLPHLDEISDTARVLGAANTIVNVQGRLEGHNTDGEGFLRSLREIGGDVAGRNVALVGAGGERPSRGAGGVSGRGDTADDHQPDPRKGPGAGGDAGNGAAGGYG